MPQASVLCWPLMPRVEFAYFDAGGGHRAAVTALEQAIVARGLAWELRASNLQEILDRLDWFQAITGVRIQDAYNGMLRREWTLGSVRLLRLLQGGIRLWHRGIVEMLEQRWRDERPDLLVSCVPNFNRALGESFARAFPGRPFVTILTDLADFPPHFWIEREPQDFICGTDRAVEQALALGHPRERIHRVSGMILAPQFYEPGAIDRRQERIRLGLDPDLATGLVLFGGYGSKAMRVISRRLDRSGLEVQLILLCGRNQALERALGAEKARRPRLVAGFTTRVSDYMRLADFFIGKPGPGSLSEAMAMRLPAIVVANARTLPQERYNAQWVLENEVGFVLGSFREIEDAVSRMIEPGMLARLRANTAKLENRAIFEIPDVLAWLLARYGPATAPSMPERVG